MQVFFFSSSLYGSSFDAAAHVFTGLFICAMCLRLNRLGLHCDDELHQTGSEL